MDVRMTRDVRVYVTLEPGKTLFYWAESAYVIHGVLAMKNAWRPGSAERQDINLGTTYVWPTSSGLNVSIIQPEKT